MQTFLRACLALAILGAATPVASQGALDWADPCVEAGQQIKSTAEAARKRADSIIAEWDARTDPPGEIRGLYVEAIRAAAYKAWSDDPSVGPMIAALKKADPGFDPVSFFLENIYAKGLSQEQEAKIVRDLYRADYSTKLRPQFVADRAALESQLQGQKKEYDSACKSDVFSQVMRATFGRALLIVNANFDAAKNEKGEIAKAIRAISGVSLTDINEHGILGGPGSDLRKLIGGPNNDLAKAIDNVSKALNPASWKIPLPKIEVKVSAPPPIEVGKVGGHRVCLPWC